MKEIPQFDLPDMFPSEEGLVDVIYGLIRSGKTYLATAKIHEEIGLLLLKVFFGHRLPAHV